jgi:hypothetical protein
MYLSCAALTQTFEYTIKSGSEFSILTNRRIKVILRILEEHPETLYYCVVEPARDAEPNHEDPFGFRYPYTTISCQLCLTLMALQSPPRSQIWCNQAIDRLHRWEIDSEEVIRSIPESDRKKSPPDLTTNLSSRPKRYHFRPWSTVHKPSLGTRLWAANRATVINSVPSLNRWSD